MATNDHHSVYFTELTILMGLRIIVLILQYFQFMIYLLINREEEGILGYVGPDIPHLSRRCSQIVDGADLGSTREPQKVYLCDACVRHSAVIGQGGACLSCSKRWAKKKAKSRVHEA